MTRHTPLTKPVDKTIPRSFFRLLILTLASGLAAAGNTSLPLFLIANHGLTDARFRYLAQAPNLHTGFAKDSIVFQLPANQIQLRFPGANRDVDVTAGRPLGGQVNFFNGTHNETAPDQRHTGLTTFAEIQYRGLYPGIDLIYTGTGAGGELKSEFRVAPGADPGRIVLLYSHPLALEDDGNLLVGDASGRLREKAPDVYQETGRGKVNVPARYRLLDSYTAAFELGTYDPAKPLIIDPVISYSTYLGGSNAGSVTGTAVDSNGNLYVAGWTSAVNFPTLAPVQSANGGDVDAFIVKLNSTGTALIYATYIGGSGDDQAAGIAVDSAGEAYVTGFTQSYNFPLVSPIRSTLGGSRAAFVLKLNSAGNALLFSTYLGGTAWDAGTAIALDSTGNAWVAGDTQSANFPLLLPLQPTFGGQTDIFLAKLTPVGALAFSTFWGGSGTEHAGGVALDPAGNVYVAGGTYSTNLPVVAALQPANAGNQDAFVMKINSSATAVVYATYLGGSGTIAGEQANGIAADPSGNAYVTGVTNSSNFPVTAGTVQTFYDGDQDAFVTKINPTGSALVYSTYLGGSDFDWGSGIGLDTAGNAYIAGYTSSFDFPTTGGVQAGFNGLYDAFVSMLNTTGGVLVFSTYYGGTGADEADAIAVDASGNMFVGGQTNSVDFPLETPLQSMNTGGATGWVARLGVTAAPPQTPAVVSVTPSSGSGTTVIFTAQYSDTGGGSSLTTAGLLVNSSAGTSFACWITYSPLANLFSLADDTPSAGSVTTPPGGANVQNDQCVLNGAASSAVVSGNTLTLTISVSFLTGFAGSKSVYLSAADAGAATGFVTLGTWAVGVPVPAPSVVSVVPNANTGANQTFVFTYSDAVSALNLTTLTMQFSTTTAVTNACVIVVDRNAGTIALESNNGLGSTTRPIIGSAAPLQNSQCTVGVLSLGLSGQTLTVTVTVFFNSAFLGTKNIYMAAAETGLNTGLIQEGTFTVVTGGTPMATSVVPNSGSGRAEHFSFTITDPTGSSYLTGMAMMFSSTNVTLANACYLFWDSSSGTISVSYDNGLATTPGVPGTNTMPSNSQCTLNESDTTVLVGTTSVVVTVDLTFAASWAGPKNIYLDAVEAGVSSGWVTMGTWTVPGGPAATSVVPSSGSGARQHFSFTITDPAGASYLTDMAMMFSTTSATIANACYVFWDSGAGTISVSYNNGLATTPGVPGTNATPSNSQCTLNEVDSTVQVGTTSVVVTVDLTFAASWAGPKNVYLNAIEVGSNSGWVQVGTWTVVAGGPMATSVVPNSGSGMGDRFSFTITDPSGSSYLTDMAMMFSTTSATIANACYLFWDSGAGTISVSYNNGLATTPGVPGTNAKPSNSQCILNEANTTVLVGTTSVVVTVDLTFTASFAGLQNIYLKAIEVGANSGWVQVGTWTVP